MKSDIEMNTERLQRKARKYAEKLHKKKEYPATIIAAGYKKSIAADRSRACDSSLLHKKLYLKLISQGGLFVRVNGNVLGCCSEVNAGNKILRILSYLNLNQINFSDAIRPRTMQIIKRCKNCNTTFS